MTCPTQAIDLQISESLFWNHPNYYLLLYVPFMIFVIIYQQWPIAIGHHQIFLISHNEINCTCCVGSCSNIAPTNCIAAQQPPSIRKPDGTLSNISSCLKYLNICKGKIDEINCQFIRNGQLKIFNWLQSIKLHFQRQKHVLLFAILVKVSLLVVRIDVRCLDLVKNESPSPKSGHNTAIYQPLLIWEPLKQTDSYKTAMFMYPLQRLLIMC